MAMGPLYMTVPILSTLRPLLGIITHPSRSPGAPGTISDAAFARRFAWQCTLEDSRIFSRILEYPRGFSRILEESIEETIQNAYVSYCNTYFPLLLHAAPMEPPWGPHGGPLGAPMGAPWGSIEKTIQNPYVLLHTPKAHPPTG